MAQVNITLDSDDMMRIFEQDAAGRLLLLMQTTLNAILRAESDEQIGAARYERCESRTDSRNGTREKSMTVRIGTMVLDVPRHRGAPFETMLFENYRRSEAALVTAMAEMVVAGVSTAKVGRVMETICGRSFSKQSVSRACAELDAAVAEFRSRPIEGECLFLMLDATYVKCRENHRVVPKALMIAVGLTPEGRKEVLGFEVADSEDGPSWLAFIESLKGRGLKAPRMATTDACEGLVWALREAFPSTAWQRCQAHFARNVADGAPKRLRAGLRSELAEMFNSATAAEARRRRDEIIADYAEAAPKAVERLDAGFEDAMTVMELPEQMRRCTRTSNFIERLNREVKRRSRVVGVFPSAGSVERLLGALLMEEDERWAAMSKCYYGNACEQLKLKEARLAEIARTQRQMSLAA